MIEGKDLRNRGEKSDEVQSDLRRIGGPRRKTEAEPDPLGERLRLARDLRPTGGIDVHCGHCWGSGRDAAIRAIEDGEI